MHATLQAETNAIHQYSVSSQCATTWKERLAGLPSTSYVCITFARQSQYGSDMCRLIDPRTKQFNSRISRNRVETAGAAAG